MMNIATVLAAIEQDGDAFRLAAPAGWYQGRALYGGLGAALCLSAAKRQDPALPPLRTAQFSFLAPAPGSLRLVPTVLRHGRSASVVAVDLLGDEGLAIRALLTFGGARQGLIVHDQLPAPSVPSPDMCPPLETVLPMPEFIANFEARPAGGEMPLSGGSDHEFLGWVRYRDDVGNDPEIALLAVADVLAPAVMVGMPRVVPFSTMAWQLDLAQPVVASPWYLVRSLGEQASDGYARQAMACWSADGRCLASGRQTVAIFS